MHVELADQLRCPVPHAGSWLVVAALRTEHRVVLEGTLGCPTCGAEYPIVRGVIDFGGAIPATGPVRPPVPVSDEDAMRAAALLNAANASARIAFVGAPIALALAVQAVVPARCLVVNASDVAIDESLLVGAPAPVAVLRTASARVLAGHALDGLWVAQGDPVEWSASIGARRRLVAPIARDVPEGFTELARDGREWVAERSTDAPAAPASLVQLRRRR